MRDYKERNLKTYEQIASEYSKANYSAFWIKEFDRFKSFVVGTKIIDIGCGAGRDAVVFVENGFEYTGVDASPAMLEIAKKRAPAAEFRRMDFFDLGFPDETFDGFWAVASFLHVPKKELLKLMLEAGRVLKQGGVGFISLKQRTEMSEGVIQQKRFGATISRYFAFYRRNEFRKYIIESGLLQIGSSVFHEDDARGTVWLGFFVKKI